VQRISELAFAEMDEILRNAWKTTKYDWEGWKKDLEIAIASESDRVFNIMVPAEQAKESIAGLIWYSFAEENSIWLTSLIVTSKLQGRGIGSKVISILEDEGIKRGKDQIELGVQRSNPRAVEFYKNRNFQELEDIEFAGTVIMRKRIRPGKSVDKRLYS
jgi:ribosomal protein S18 acetylase RimI-like enzyme